MKKTKLLIFMLGLLAGACASAAQLSGTVKIDGSSTVFPVTEAIAEEFRAIEPKVRVTIGVSGTGGGFKKFTSGETDISNASRSIKGSEIAMAEKTNTKYLELPVAYDGITVVVNKQNTWANTLTVDELKKIWQPGSTVKLWSDVRKGFPEKKIKLYGPGTDSGTFDYFTEAINGKSHVSRSDFTKSEDDNVLVTGVAGDKYALGYFGYAYYEQNKGKIKAVAIDNGNGPIAPSVKSINDGSYAPLSRPIFIYVSKKSSQRPEVKTFVSYYLSKVGSISEEVGYVSLPEKIYTKAKTSFAKFSESDRP